MRSVLFGIANSAGARFARFGLCRGRDDLVSQIVDLSGP